MQHYYLQVVDYVARIVVIIIYCLDIKKAIILLHYDYYNDIPLSVLIFTRSKVTIVC